MLFCSRSRGDEQVKKASERQLWALDSEIKDTHDVRINALACSGLLWLRSPLSCAGAVCSGLSGVLPARRAVVLALRRGGDGGQSCVAGAADTRGEGGCGGDVLADPLAALHPRRTPPRRGARTHDHDASQWSDRVFWRAQVGHPLHAAWGQPHGCAPLRPSQTDTIESSLEDLRLAHSTLNHEWLFGCLEVVEGGESTLSFATRSLDSGGNGPGLMSPVSLGSPTAAMRGMGKTLPKSMAAMTSGPRNLRDRSQRACSTWLVVRRSGGRCGDAAHHAHHR